MDVQATSDPQRHQPDQPPDRQEDRIDAQRVHRRARRLPSTGADRCHVDRYMASSIDAWAATLNAAKPIVPSSQVHTAQTPIGMPITASAGGTGMHAAAARGSPRWRCRRCWGSRRRDGMIAGTEQVRFRHVDPDRRQRAEMEIDRARHRGEDLRRDEEADQGLQQKRRWSLIAQAPSPGRCSIRCHIDRRFNVQPHHHGQRCEGVGTPNPIEGGGRDGL